MKILPTFAQGFWLLILCCLLAGVAVANDDSAGSSDAESDEYFQLEKCINSSRIRSTTIIDDRTIVFYMRQQKIFVNQLPHRCGGLRSAGTFGYRTTISRLCDIDTITVIRPGSMGGRGPTCRLGKFRPVTEEEVAMLKNKEIEPLPKERPPVAEPDAEDAGNEEAEES